MTGQSLLDRCEVLNQELQLQAGESDVTRGLTALNMAQDYFESLAAVRPKILGSTTGTLVTAASTESSSFPTGLLRLDRLVTLDTNSRPDGELVPLHRTGGHSMSSFWPLNITLPQTAGKPRAYEASGGVLWWNPLPDAIYTLRWYGFAAASDITASGTFAYPDIVALPLASFAVKLMKMGLDDSPQEATSLAVDTFTPALDALALFNRDGAKPLEYTSVHLT